jgi:hypothetical protein
VDSRTSDISTSNFDLARVQPEPYLNAEASQHLADGTRAFDGTPRPVEGGKEPVPGGVHLAAPEPLQLAAHRPIVRVE